MDEFDLIRRFFTGAGARRADVTLGVGDDCALLRVPAGMELAVSIDTLVAGVHFFADCDPHGLGHKALAVGLSDLAAMGAEPAWATLAVTLPGADESWIGAFARGFAALASRHGVALVGGDTTRGPLTLSVQVHGWVPEGCAVRRAGARPGDLICITGTLGDAGLALQLLNEGSDPPPDLRARLERPSPRVAAGLCVRGLASAMIDVSDGLAADLGHILTASGVGAEVHLGELPLSRSVAARIRLPEDWALPVASGDDYELCFTVAEDHRCELESLARGLGCGVRVVGRITHEQGLTWRLPDGAAWQPRRGGYDHFAGLAQDPFPVRSNDRDLDDAQG